MYNILIVEDSKPILRDIERLIRENLKETEIETAYDGEEALAFRTGHLIYRY